MIDDKPIPVAEKDKIPAHYLPAYEQTKNEAGEEQMTLKASLLPLVNRHNAVSGELNSTKTQIDALKRENVDGRHNVKGYNAILAENGIGEKEQTPDGLKALIEKVSKSDGNSTLEVEAVRNSMTEKFNKDKAELKKDNKALQSALSGTLASKAIAEAAQEHNANVHLLNPVISSQIGVEKSDEGTWTHYVKGSDGKKLLDNGVPVSVSDYVKTLKGNEHYAGMFKSEIKTTPTTPGNKPGMAVSDDDKTKISTMDAMKKAAEGFNIPGID